MTGQVEISDYTNISSIEIKNTFGAVIYTVDASNLIGAYLIGADLRGANLSRADLSWENMRGADLRGANLSRADLSWANMRGAYLIGADLRGANLSRADLSRADLRWADLRGADLRGANLSRADLSWANMRGADLRGADLRGADLMDVVGNMRELKSMQIDRYSVAWTADRLQIGCKNHPIADWFAFDDDTIAAMDNGAIEWWTKYRELIRMAICLSPATPTGHENA